MPSFANTFLEAIKAGDLIQVQNLAAQHLAWCLQSPNAQVGLGAETWLNVAVASASVDVLRALLQCGFDPNIPGVSGNYPVHTAIIHRSRDHLVALVEHGASLAARDILGRQPLHLAVTYRGAEALVQTLLDLGAVTDEVPFLPDL
ncbi:MAG: Ankyrin repeat and protein kinase domain-containing protein 1 [Bathelium mastoideum]|nr:MAG: Ankyrin repeat and protein kinase domain-containing protein 1 [Bathelium mastoideum]